MPLSSMMSTLIWALPPDEGRVLGLSTPLVITGGVVSSSAALAVPTTASDRIAVSAINFRIIGRPYSTAGTPARTQVNIVPSVPDALAQYRVATEANDVAGIMATLAPDAELVSPISGRMVFRGSDDVEHLLAAVYGTLKELRWIDEIGDGKRRVLFGEARLLGVRMTDAMVFDLDAEGRIRRIGPHLRPWLALTLFALVLGPKVGRRPGMVFRALRS